MLHMVHVPYGTYTLTKPQDMTRQICSAVLLAALLSACGINGASQPANINVGAVSDVAPAAPGHINTIPATPTSGKSRAGLTYSIYIQVPATGDTFAFTVFEPSTLEGGKKYPLLLYGHGAGDKRATDRTSPQLVYSPFNDNIKLFLDNGYGVISMDQRGHGESSGTIRALDPDYEGRDLLALLDWAEAKLDWLDYGTSVDGSDPHNLKLGAIGASYGGGFQMLIQNIDPKHRLDAIVPEATWYDTNYSLAPNGVLKSLWAIFLYGKLSTTGNNPTDSHLDPYLQSMLNSGVSGAKFTQEQHDFLYYHSNAYFCNGQPVTTNGGPGTAPLFPPQPSGRINAMFFQGMRDTLFNFREAYQNYQCLKQAGGDVRLLSYQTGHNATPVIPDAGLRPVMPDPNNPNIPLNAYDDRCGTLSVHDATLAFFDEHLKGIAGAADRVPKHVCLSLAVGDSVLVDQVSAGHAGIQKDVPATNVIAGVLDMPMSVDLGIVAGAQGDVIGGIPRLEVDIEPAAAGIPGEPIIFAGIGQMRASAPGVWELVDNQISPLRGTGMHQIDMAGVAERLSPGDKIALLFYGGHDQFVYSGSINVSNPTVMPVTVQGKVWIPMLGALPPTH